MAFSPEIQQQIIKVRRDNQKLMVNMTDEDIVLLLQQADQVLEYGQPMAFVVPRPKRTLAEADKQHPDDLTAKERVMRGQRLKDIGRWPDAEQTLLRAIEQAKQTNDLPCHAWALGVLGGLYRDRGDLSPAIVAYGRAKELAEQIGSSDGQHLIGVALDGIGTVYGRQGNYSLAIEHYQKSISTCIRIGDVYQLAITSGNLGNAYLNQRDYEQAQNHFIQALIIDERIGDERGKAMDHFNLGMLCLRMEDDQQARPHLQRARDLFELAGDKDKARITIQLLQGM